MKDLSIVIVNWNSADYVRSCLNSLVAAFPSEALPRVIVVDGASFDGCDDMVAKEFPWVKFVQVQENNGFGYANNVGVEQVDTEYVLLLNPDTEVKDSAIQDMMQCFSSHENVGIVGAKLLNTDGSLQTSSVQAFPTPWNQALDSNVLRRLFPRSQFWGTRCYFSDTVSEVQGVSGACMLMRTAVFREVGGFDTSYFMYAEDMDLSWKVAESGRKNIFVASAEIIHHGGGSSGGEFSKFSNIEMKTSLHYFISKRSGAGAAFTYRLAMGVSALLRHTLLIPAMLLSSFSKKNSYRRSIKKWWNTLLWALSIEKSKAPRYSS